MAYSEKELLDELKRVSEEYCDGKTPTSIKMEEHGKYSSVTYANRFGSWNKALKKAGLSINKKRTQCEFNEEEISKELSHISQKFKDGGTPSQSDIDTHASFSAGYLRNRYGSWNDAVVEFGFEPRTKHAGGEEHWAWEGGGDNKYNNFHISSKKRKEILYRDNKECRICGSSEKILDIHHITPIKFWNFENEKEKMNHPRNLITLCRSCHHSKLEGKFKGRNHKEFEELAKNYLDIDEKEEKRSVFDY